MPKQTIQNPAARKSIQIVSDKSEPLGVCRANILKCKREVRFWRFLLLASMGAVAYEVYTMLYTDKTLAFDWEGIIIVTVLAVWICFYDLMVAKRKLKFEQQFYQ